MEWRDKGTTWGVTQWHVSIFRKDANINKWIRSVFQEKRYYTEHPEITQVRVHPNIPFPLFLMVIVLSPPFAAEEAFGNVVMRGLRHVGCAKWGLRVGWGVLV
jgi:hypothetical protein